MPHVKAISCTNNSEYNLQTLLPRIDKILLSSINNDCVIHYQTKYSKLLILKNNMDAIERRSIYKIETTTMTSLYNPLINHQRKCRAS